MRRLVPFAAQRGRARRDWHVRHIQARRLGAAEARVVEERDEGYRLNVWKQAEGSDTILA